MPLTFSYLAETCPRATRTRYTGLLHSFWPLGALFTSILAHLILPTDGADIVSDNLEHWSSWHKILMMNNLPIVTCMIGLIWTSESPRYLLEASREIEALEVYQKLHKINRSRTQYGLTELELPGRNAFREKPRNTSRNVLALGIDSVSMRMVKINFYNFIFSFARSFNACYHHRIIKLRFYWGLYIYSWVFYIWESPRFQLP